MYIRHYKDTDDTFYNYLEDLYENSIQKYLSNVCDESNCFERRRDLNSIFNYVRYLEDFVTMLDRKDYIPDYRKVFHNLKSINSISILPHTDRELNVINENGNIFVNPSNNNINRYYLYKEFCNCLHTGWKKDRNNFIDGFRDNYSFNKDKSNISDGIDVLDFSTTFNVCSDLLNYKIYDDSTYLFSKVLFKESSDPMKSINIISLDDNFLYKMSEKYNRSYSDGNIYNALVNLGNSYSCKENNIVYHK